jgi:endoglucanase
MARFARPLLPLLLALLGALAPAAARAASGNPFAGARLFVDPASNAARQARAWQGTRPSDAQLLQKIAGQPQANWYDYSSGVYYDVADRVRQITRAGALPVLVAYFIPNRDCGSFSSGGARSPAAYRAWVGRVAAGLHGDRAAVILEPDALADFSCLDAAARRSREGLLAYATAVLTRHGASVYIDAGNAGWQPAATMAARLRSAGIARARGFALNVSNFDTTAGEAAYGHRLSAALGGKPFVVDTSRNGRGPAPGNTWCNPPGRGLGSAPTADTGDPAIDAFLWIKAPGESDGSCAGGPPAGAWWPQYALGLAQRATF